jgi:hypothetical protein
MAARPFSERSTVPLSVGVLAALAIAVGWLVFEGAPFVLGCIVMLALIGSEVTLLVQTPPRRD